MSKVRWTTEEEDLAIKLLSSGRTYKETSEIMNRGISSISKKNLSKWHIDLKNIDYKEKLSRGVSKSAHKISAWQKEHGKWAGSANPNYGAKIARYGKENPLSIWKKENPGYQDGDKNPSYGRIASAEEIETKTRKVREHAKNRIGKTNEQLYGKEVAERMSNAVKIAAISRIANQKSSGTGIELEMKAILDKLGLLYNYQHPFDYYCVDFYLPSYNLVLFTDGCYWHGHTCVANSKGLDERQRNRIRLDHSCDSYLVNRGYRVLRFWECELSLSKVIDSLKSVGIILSEKEC
jgi:DNA mismatch endonuclease (patch repair protein)